MMSLLLKLIYSVLLVGIAGIAVRELWTVWFDTRVYIGSFDVVSDSGKDDSASEAFPKRIIAEQILSQQMSDYQQRQSADGSRDTTYAISGMTPLQLPPEALAGIDITVQSINLRQVFTAVRRGFLAPNEVRGRVTQRPNSVLVTVEWPQAPRPANKTPAPTRFLAPSRPNAEEAAAYVACSISWARAANLDATFANFPRAQICDFATALGDLYALEDKASTGAGLDTEQTALVRHRAATLWSHYNDTQVFPDIYRLRADLLDLLPEQARTQNELIDAQEDRLRYAMLSPDLRDLPEETKRLAALALARPAIVLEDGKPKNVAANWSALLARHPTEIATAAAATGLIVSGGGEPSGTGFIVGPGLMMTAAHVLKFAAAEVGERKPARLCLGPSQGDCGISFDIGKVVYDGTRDGGNLMLAEISGHDPLIVPPLAFVDPLPAANTLVGSYSYAVGYPFSDSRVPSEFITRLLKETPGTKRIMPGRVLALGLSAAGVQGEIAHHPVITTDISTSGGTAGAPLIELQSGRVIGLSYAGLWQGERGKFAYADPISRAALDLIARRTRGEAEPNASASPGNGAAVPATSTTSGER